MNILFYTTNEVAPQYGGVERVTANIANALTTFYNVNCYSAYKYNIDKSFIKQQFVNTIKINSYHNLNNLIQFIEQNKIDVIINQGEHKLTKSLRLALNQSQNKKCKLMFALHVSPATEINFITLDNPKKGLSGNFWLVSFKISYLCLPLFYETRTTPSCHPSGCAYRQL